MNKTIIKTVVITIIIIAIILSLTYFGLKEYNDNYNQGVQDGVATLYLEILDQVGKCEAYPFPANNRTFSLILAECLQIEG